MKIKNLIAFFLIISNMPVFAQDEDLSLIPYRLGDLWGYANPDKKIVIPPAYKEANLFYEGYAVVKKGSRYGYINKAGQVVIPFKFYVAKPFRLGYYARGNKIVTADDLVDNQNVVLFAGASLRPDGYEICINTKGETMPGCPAIPENSASDLNKLPVIVTETNYSTVKKNDIFDRIVGDYKIAGMEDNYYIAVKELNYGVFNNKFEVIIPFEFLEIKKWDIHNSVFLEVQGKQGKGLLKADGQVSIPPENNTLSGIKALDGNYYFIFSKNGKAGIKDAHGADLLPSNYADIIYEPAGGFLLTGNDNLKGFRFLNGFILEPGYSIVKPVKGGVYVMVTSKTGRSGYINNKGEEFFVE